MSRKRPPKTEWDKALRMVGGALKACIVDHGPITQESIGSASKRILCFMQGEDMLNPSIKKTSVADPERKTPARAE